jgi:hypothetical protein
VGIAHQISLGLAAKGGQCPPYDINFPNISNNLVSNHITEKILSHNQSRRGRPKRKIRKSLKTINKNGCGNFIPAAVSYFAFSTTSQPSEKRRLTGFYDHDQSWMFQVMSVT